MKTKAKFKHYSKRPKKLTSAFAKLEYDKLLARLPAAEKSDEATLWLKLFKDWNALRSYLSSEGSRIGFKFSQNMADKKADGAEKYLREKVAPVTEEPDHQLTKAFLASKHREALADHFGRQLITVYEVDIKPSDPINADLRVGAGKLGKKYEKKIAGAQIMIAGQKMTLWKSRSLLESPKESIRKEAYLANRGWFLDNLDELAKLYDKLVKLRQQMAKNVGYQNYIPFAYDNLGRTDYNQKMVENFRASVKKYAVPLNRKIAERKAKALGKEQLRPWDAYDPETSLPLGIVPVEKQLAQAQKVFDKLSPKLGQRFKFMRRSGLIDLENRPNKRSGAFCTDFSDEGKVAVFCNSVGDADDVSTITHEMGHAFQSWESQHIEAVDLQWGTLDLSEVHSTGLEFLSLPYVSEFFAGKHAAKFVLSRWEESVGLLCYVALVDEFQHWVFSRPQASPAERDKKWCELADVYLAPVDYSGYEKYQKTRWYWQSHIFTSPFYYIDYALAETSAMQLAVMMSKNHQAALDRYLKLCSIGGTKSFLQALDYAGLRSPFEAGLVKELMDHAASELNV